MTLCYILTASGYMVLKTEALTKKFGMVNANDRIDFSVSEGEVRGIIGPNGAGKSTFFNVLTGFYSPDEGKVVFQGRDVTDMSPAEIAQEGMVRTFQIASPFEELTVMENVLASYSSGLRIDGQKRERAWEVLELLDIADHAEEDAANLSGGQQKLLELARVLMLDPECILLDEPTAGVNPALQEDIVDYLRQLNESEGTTLVIIEHDMKVISDVTDSVTVFNQGQAVVEGPFEEIKNDERVREAYLGSASGDEEEVPI